jgi:hypothetical protein
MWVVITRDEKRDSQLMRSSSESEVGTVDRESYGTAEAGDRDRGWKSSGRWKRTEATGKHSDWRGRGEECGRANGERRKELGANVGATLELRMQAERHIPPIFD